MVVITWLINKENKEILKNEMKSVKSENKAQYLIRTYEIIISLLVITREFILLQKEIYLNLLILSIGRYTDCLLEYYFSFSTK